jgi:predicted house-cleaning NTP pyrophosphatase (Maf/HAM1 superfamily)
VEIIPSGFEETLEKSTYAKPEDYVLDTARGKAKDVMETLVKTDNVRWLDVCLPDPVPTNASNL